MEVLWKQIQIRNYGPQTTSFRTQLSNNAIIFTPTFTLTSIALTLTSITSITSTTLITPTHLRMSYKSPNPYTSKSTNPYWKSTTKILHLFTHILETALCLKKLNFSRSVIILKHLNCHKNSTWKLSQTKKTLTRSMNMSQELKWRQKLIK